MSKMPLSFPMRQCVILNDLIFPRLDTYFHRESEGIIAISLTFTKISVPNEWTAVRRSWRTVIRKWALIFDNTGGLVNSLQAHIFFFVISTSEWNKPVWLLKSFWFSLRNPCTESSKSSVSVVKYKDSQSFYIRRELLRLVPILARTASSSFLQSFLIVFLRFLSTWVIEWADWVLTRVSLLTI
jgi:hypothetical protein